MSERITAKGLAARIDGREYRSEVDNETRELAKANGLLIVYGASDDLCEFDGIFRDEGGCYDGGIFLVDRDGIIPRWDELDGPTEREAKAWFARKGSPHITIKAIWCGVDSDAFWEYSIAGAPSETFEVMKDDELYCIGRVVDMNNLGEPQ